MIDRQRVVKEFNSYVLGYDMFDERIQLKKEHTFHVAKNCEEIAKNSGFSKEDIDIAWLSGILHDIGRFEQIRRMNTFHDTKYFTQILECFHSIAFLSKGTKIIPPQERKFQKKYKL